MNVKTKNIYVRADSDLQYTEFVTKMRMEEGGEDLEYIRLLYADQITDLNADIYDITGISRIADNLNIEYMVM